MKRKTLIEKQLKRKTNRELVKTIIAAKKSKAWNKIAGMVSSPRKKYLSINLKDLNKESKEGEKIVIPGKVLSEGELNKKVKIIALNFSEKAREKIIKAGGEAINMLNEIKSNPDAKEIRVLRK